MQVLDNVAHHVFSFKILVFIFKYSLDYFTHFSFKKMQVVPAGRCGRRCCQPACTDRTSTPDPPETSLDIQLFFVFLSRRVQDYQTSMNGKQVRILNFFLFSSTRLQNYQTSTNLDSQLFLVFFLSTRLQNYQTSTCMNGKNLFAQMFHPILR